MHVPRPRQYTDDAARRAAHRARRAAEEQRERKKTGAVLREAVLLWRAAGLPHESHEALKAALRKLRKAGATKRFVMKSYTQNDAAVIFEDVIWIDPDRMGGEPCFLGTRVPVKALWDYVENGKYTLDEFLDHFEGVPRECAVKTLRLSLNGLLERLPRFEQHPA